MMNKIKILEYSDCDEKYISKNFELFLDNILANKKLQDDVKKYIYAICGDILMCNIDNIDLFKQRLKMNKPAETFEEKVYYMFSNQ